MGLKNTIMAKSRDSGLWMAFAGELAIKIATSIERARQFSTSVVTSEVRPRNTELAVVHLNIQKYEEEEFGINSGCYLAVSQSGRQIATGQSTVVVSNVTHVPGITTATIRKLLPRRFSRSFTPPSDGVYRPSPRLWEQLLAILGSRLPGTGVQLPDLLRATDESRKPRGRIAGGLDVFERDAIATVIQAWRGEQMRKRVLRQAVPTRAAPVATFLANLEHVSVREDPQIIHDQNTFPGMEVARRDVVGSVVLGEGDEFLTILNCNRQPLERTLGVDLIYYSHRYDSFVLVQYKRMSVGTDEVEYRPSQDPNYERELKRMIEATRMLAEIPRGPNDVDTFRLLETPFYIKLCEPKIKAALDAGMVSGMYVPLALWRRLLDSPSVRGPRGGIVVTWENCVRRFNTAEFTKLLREGWIGSAAGRSRALSSIIEGTLASKRMLIIGATSPGGPSRDYRRDSFGRFAAEGDPAGSI
jgi:hypothetical protein